MVEPTKFKISNPWRAEPVAETILDGDGQDLLSVSWDADYDPENTDEWKAVLLWSHRLAEPGDHEHIVMDQEAARKLHDWLGRFLNKVDK